MHESASRRSRRQKAPNGEIDAPNARMPHLGRAAADTLSLYLNEIASSSPLSSQEEAALASRIRRGDKNARDRLVQANLRFVVKVARYYTRTNVSLGDLISAGNLGLLKAAERFDPAQGTRFITYAVWWIRQAITQCLAQQTYTVHLPAERITRLRAISKATRRLHRTGNSAPDTDQIAHELGLLRTEVEDALISAYDARPLDAHLDEDGDGSLLDLLSDGGQEAPDASLLRNAARRHLRRYMGRLDAREREILLLLYGFGGEDPMTLDRIGLRLGLTRERIRQLKERALQKLRRVARPDTLRELIADV